MKNSAKTLFLFFFLSISSAIISMEKSVSDEPIEEIKLLAKKPLVDLGLPHEIWAIILRYSYLDPSILNEAKDIYEAIEMIEKHFKIYYLRISLVCKAFKDLNISKEKLDEFKITMSEFYIPYLNEKFLEAREGKEGLYPKNGEWHKFLNKQIATFLTTGLSESLLHNIVTLTKLGSIKIASQETLKLIHLLLFYGIDPNTQNTSGVNALHNAVFDHHEQNKNNKDIIIFLLNVGANPNIHNGIGTMLYWAIDCHESKRRNNKDIITLLLHFGANPNIKGEQGNPLGSAVYNHHDKDRNNKDIIMLLLESGANPNIQGKKRGNTPLYLAVYKHDDNKQNNKDIAILLLEAQADPNIPNYKHITPLLYAIKNPKNQNKKNIIAPLLEFGANPYIKDKKDRTSFDIAQEKNFHEFPGLVIKHSRNGLLNRCLFYILNNLDLYENQLDTLPIELQDKINNLRSN